MKRAVIVVLAAAAAFFLFTRGSDPYVAKMNLPNAYGLRDGSPVVIGGVTIGEVKLAATREDVEARLEIEPKYAPLGENASATIIAQNVLGQKQVLVEPGDTSKPAADGFTIQDDLVSANTDLDQLLGELDTDTRARLAVLINETGSAFAGRKMDFATFINDFAPALSRFGNLAEQLDTDNQALDSMLRSSDRFVGELAKQRTHIDRMIAALGGTTETFWTHRAQLRETLRRAPAALRATRGFLAELRGTAAPLGETSRLLAQSAPSLQRTLDQLGPFRRNATPVLRALVKSAPTVTSLSENTTPILRDATPLSVSLVKASSREIPRTGRILDHSTDNLIATIENWSNAIQFRDRLSHIFRGEASFAPDFYQSLLDNIINGGLPAPAAATTRSAPTRLDGGNGEDDRGDGTANPDDPTALPDPGTAQGNGGGLGDALDGLGSGQDNGIGGALGGAGRNSQSAADLLSNYLAGN